MLHALRTRQGVDRVVATCPIREDGVLNVVMGVNHLDYDASQHTIVTASSCTTNCLATVLALIWFASLFLLRQDLGKAGNKPKFTEVFSKSAAISRLSAARMFLFGARDVWFVVALPVFLASSFGWDHWQVGGLLALWIIGYGIVQAFGLIACLWVSAAFLAMASLISLLLPVRTAQVESGVN